jgi:hypothetical protein
MIKIKFLARKFLYLNLILQHYFSLRNTSMRKGNDPDPESDPYF